MGIIRIIKEFIASGYSGGAQGNMIAGRNKDALKKIKKALAIDPGDEENILYVSTLGEVYMRLKQYDKAIPILEKVLDRMDIEMKAPPDDWELDHYADVSKYLQYCKTQINNNNQITNEIKRGWEHRFPNLTGKWTHWKILGDGNYLDLINGSNLSNALIIVENNYGKFKSIKVCRASVDENGNLKEEEKSFSEISRYIYDKAN